MVLLRNTLNRSRVFTLKDGSTFRLSAKFEDGDKKELKNTLVSEELAKEIKEGTIISTNIKPKYFKKSSKKDKEV